MYSARVKQLVAELRHSGPLADRTHQGEGENPVCGDWVRYQLKVNDGQVEDCRFQASGCVAAIAAAAAVAERCRNRSVGDCLAMTSDDLLAELAPLPPHKLHAVNLALQALAKALTPGENLET